MAKTYRQPADMNVSSFLDKPGSYHFMIGRVDEEPKDKDGKPLDGICVETTVLSGTDASQEKRVFNPLLFNPSEGSKDGGNFAATIHLRLADAIGIYKPVAAGEDVEIDWTKAAGRQFVAHVKFGKEKANGERYLEFGAHSYHVDDEEVKLVPKNAKALALLPPQLRRFGTDPNNAKANGGGAKKSTPPKQQQQLAGAGAGANGGGAVDLNDL